MDIEQVVIRSFVLHFSFAVACRFSHSFFSTWCSWPGKVRDPGETASRFYADLMSSDALNESPTHGARTAAKTSPPSQRRSGMQNDACV